MADLYDEDGNKVEVMGEEEIQALEEKASKAEEYETKIKEHEEELNKYREKDFNFSNLRGKSEAEKEELLKDFSEKEKKMIEKMERMEERIGDYHTTTMSSYESEILTALAQDDDDLKTKIKERSKDFVGEPKTKEDMLKRYKNAYTLLKGEVPSVNAINQFTPSRGAGADITANKRYTDTDKGKSNYQNWFKDSEHGKEDKK